MNKVLLPLYVRNPLPSDINISKYVIMVIQDFAEKSPVLPPSSIYNSILTTLQEELNVQKRFL